MSTLDRYVLKEIAVPFFVGLGLFCAVVAFAQVLKISDSVTGLGITGSEVLRALIYSLPPLMGLLIPVSALFATLLAVGRLASDREVIALSAVGISPFRLLKVPFLVGCLLAALCTLAMVEGEPWGMRGLRSLLAHSAQRALARGVKVGEFTQWIPGVTFLAQGRDGEDLTDVVFADRRDESRPVIISAERGHILGGERARDIAFDLERGFILARDEESASYRVIHFDGSRYRVNVRKIVGQNIRSLSRLQAKDILTLIEDIGETRSQRQRARLAVTLHRKLALPVATIIFALLAVPLGCRTSGGARGRSIVYSAAMVGAYYYLGRAVELSARSGRVNEHLAAWVPNLIGLVLLAILLYRFRRRAA